MSATICIYGIKLLRKVLGLFEVFKQGIVLVFTHNGDIKWRFVRHSAKS